jgi:Ni/Fe-hydrogenase subunit HybB-like protein
VVPERCCALVIVKKRHKKPLSELAQGMTIAVAIAGGIVLVQVIYKAFTYPELQKILEWDGTIALIIGCSASLYLPIKEIVKLFKS